MKDSFSVGSGPTTPSTDVDPLKKKKKDDTPVDVTPTTGPSGSEEAYKKAMSSVMDKPTATTRSYLGMDASEAPTTMDKHKRTEVVDYGNIFKEIFVFLGNVSMPIDPNNIGAFLKGSFTGQIHGDGDPNSMATRNAKALDTLLDGLKASGTRGGSFGQMLVTNVTMERSKDEEVAVGSLPKPELKSPPKLTVDKLPPYWEFNASAKYASDSAKRKKDAAGADKDVNSPASQHRDMAASLQVSGQMGKIKVEFHSMGVQDVDDQGTLVNHSGKEAPTYEAVDQTKGNAKDTRAKLEKARYVKADVKKDGTNVTMTIESGCDIVRSNWDVKNMGPKGQPIVAKYSGKTVTLSGSNTPVTMTANDVLSVTRSYAEARHHNREMIAYALKSNPELAPDLLKDMQACGKDPAKLDAFFAKAEADPRLANVGLEMPKEIQLGRRGDDGQWHGLVDAGGKPVTISRAELETLISSQTVKTMPQEDPSSTINDPPRPGSELTNFGPDDADKLANDNATALNAGLDMPVSKKTGGKTTDKTVDLGQPIGDPPSKDEGVTTIVSHTDSPKDAQVLQDNADTVDGSLADAAELFRNGALNQKDLPADQQKKIADALQNYLRIKDANAAKDLRNMLYSMQKGGAVGNFINAVIKRLDASVRLNTALNLLPMNLRHNINSKIGVDNVSIGGSTIHVTGKQVPGMESVMNSDPKTSKGANQIVGAVLRAQAPKLGATTPITDWAGSIARMNQDFKTSTQLTTAARTMSQDIAHDLANGVKPADIEKRLTTELFGTMPNPPKVKLTVSDDGKTFQVSVESEKPVPKGLMDRAKAANKDQLGMTNYTAYVKQSLSDDIFPKGVTPPDISLVPKGDEFVVSVSVPLFGGQMPPKTH